jgi:hypothetical protein
MATAFAFLGILLTSLLVAELAALSLGDFFGADDEFLAVIAVVAAFTTFSLIVFAGVYAWGRSAPALCRAALALALLAVVLVTLAGMVPWLASQSTNPFAAGEESIGIALQLFVPALLAVLIQWSLARRRLLRSAGEEDLTRWPWITTAVACLVLLNPFGLTFVQASLNRSSADSMWPYVASVTAGTLCALVVMATIECYIRGRMLRRHRNATLPAGNGGAGAHARASSA